MVQAPFRITKAGKHSFYLSALTGNWRVFYVWILELARPKDYEFNPFMHEC